MLVLQLETNFKLLNLRYARKSKIRDFRFWTGNLPTSLTFPFFSIYFFFVYFVCKLYVAAVCEEREPRKKRTTLAHRFEKNLIKRKTLNDMVFKCPGKVLHEGNACKQCFDRVEIRSWLEYILQH